MGLRPKPRRGLVPGPHYVDKRGVTGRVISEPFAAISKVLVELFQKLAGRGQRPRRRPQTAKLPCVQELGGLGDLR